MRLLGAVVAICLALPTVGHAAGPTTGAPLLAHRAMYALTLNKKATSAIPGSDTIAARGTMAYEIVDACDGWTVRQQMRISTTNTDGQISLKASDYATWESKDGLRFKFHSVDAADDSIVARTDGDASLSATGGAGKARYRTPETSVVPLPAGTMFPTAHTLAIMNAARGGKKFVALPLFDGTDEAGVQDSSVAIVDWKKPAATKFPALNNAASTRVRMAFFERKPSATTPAFQIGVRYWENGVADDMEMNFGEMVLDGKLTELALLPKRC